MLEDFYTRPRAIGPGTTEPPRARAAAVLCALVRRSGAAGTGLVDLDRRAETAVATPAASVRSASCGLPT